MDDPKTIQEDSLLEEEIDFFQLIDRSDKKIFMHRECLFGGSLDNMFAYYQNGSGRGCHSDIPIQKIIQFQNIEREHKKNLSLQILEAEDWAIVGQVREKQQQLIRLIRQKNAKNPIPQYIAALILSEKESPSEEIDAIVSHVKQYPEAAIATTDALVILLRDPFFAMSYAPGYGYAPQFAACCLGKIGNPSAILPIFEQLLEWEIEQDTLWESDCGMEENESYQVIFSVLKSFGEKSKQLLLQQIKQQPFSRSNKKAAALLEEFPECNVVAKESFFLLQDLVRSRDPKKCDEDFLLSLVYLCGGLRKEEEGIQFAQLAKEPFVSSWIREEIRQTYRLLDR